MWFYCIFICWSFIYWLLFSFLFLLLFRLCFSFLFHVVFFFFLWKDCMGTHLCLILLFSFSLHWYVAVVTDMCLKWSSISKRKGHIHIIWMWFWLCLLQYISTSFLCDFHRLSVSHLTGQVVMNHLVFCFFFYSICFVEMCMYSEEKYCTLQKSLLSRVMEHVSCRKS